MPISSPVRRFRGLAAAVLLIAALTACDAQAGPTPSPSSDSRQVTVVGEGQVQGTPDTLTVNASTETLAPDATTAMEETNERGQAIIDALVELGIDRADLATTEASLQPQFGGADNTTITAYRATNSLNIKIRDLAKASDAIGLVVSTGGDAARVNSISYSIDDESQLVRDARARAFKDAEERARQYAQLSGLTLGKVISINEAGGPTPPVPMTMMPDAPRAMEAAVPLEPGQQSVGFSVTVIWELV